jgi:hypothetical protein
MKPSHCKVYLVEVWCYSKGQERRESEAVGKRETRASVSLPSADHATMVRMHHCNMYGAHLERVTVEVTCHCDLNVNMDVVSDIQWRLFFILNEIINFPLCLLLTLFLLISLWLHIQMHHVIYCLSL